MEKPMEFDCGIIHGTVLEREVSVRRTGWLEWGIENKEQEQTDWSGVRRDVFTGHSQQISIWFWGQPAAWALTPSIWKSNYVIWGKLLMLDNSHLWKGKSHDASL